MNAERLIQALREVAAAPGENMQLGLVLLGAVVLLVAVLIVLLLLAYSLVRKPAPKPRARIRRVRKADGTVVVQRIVPKVVPAAPKPRPELTPEQLERLRRRARVLPWVTAALVVLAFAGSYAASSSRAFCGGTCHAGSPTAVSAEKDAHKDVACVSCHEEPLPLGAVANIASRGSFLVAQSQGTTGPAGADVPSSRCLRCHADIRTGVSVDESSGVRVSHAEPIAAGMACSDCHSRTGHSPRPAERGRARMNACVTCHDGVKAPAKCETCHTGDTSKAASAKGRHFTGTVRLGRVADCGGCHSQKSCDSCHGLRMPHSERFIAGGHARQGAFGGKVTCYRCHTTSDCQRCHQPFASSGHPAGWAQEHAKAPATSGCSCHQVKMPAEQRDKPFCQACHGREAEALKQ